MTVTHAQKCTTPSSGMQLQPKGWGRNFLFLLCSKQAFERTGGFDETLFAGEDVAMSRALAAIGRFVIVREQAHTSARKMHSHGWAGHLKLMGHYMMRGNKILRDRKHLGIWYDPR